MFDLIAFTLDFLGKLLIAYTAIKVHHRFWQEKKIDAAVFKVMRREQFIGLWGIGLMAAGYLAHLFSFLQTTL